MKRMKLRGTMLIMVAAVMLILIIFCLATFAMVSSANKRAYLKFEDNQSYYTAASALDVFASGMMSDGVLYSYNINTATGKPNTSSPRNYYDSDNTGTGVPKMTQGRALELDMYKLSVMTDAGNPDETTIGKGKDGASADFFPGASNYADLNLIINATDENYFYNSATAPNDDDYAKQFAVASGTSAPFKYAEYILDMPGVSSSGNAFSATDSYGLFADPVVTGSGSAAKTTYPAKITVEMIERYYNMEGVEQSALKEYMKAALDHVNGGSAPTAAQESAVGAIIDTTLTPHKPTAAKIKEAIQKGDRTKDYLHIKVTAETTLMGVTGTAAREFIISTPMPASNGNAITNFGYNKSGASLASVGGLTSLISTRIPTAANAGYIFSGGQLNFNTTGSGTIISEDTIHETQKTPFVMALDQIRWDNIPTYINQGYNTLFYAVNGIRSTTDGDLGSSSLMYHMVSGGEFQTPNSVNIYGTLTTETINVVANELHIYDTNPSGAGNYGQAFINTLTINDPAPLSSPNPTANATNVVAVNANHIIAEGGIYAQDLIIGQKDDGLTEAVLMGGADDGAADDVGDDDPLDGENDHPYVIQLNLGITLNYSGYVYRANDTATPRTKYIIVADSASDTGFYVYRDDTPTNKQPIIVTTPFSITPSLPLGNPGGTFVRNTSIPKIAVNYYGDMDGDGALDYTMQPDFKKEINVPFNFVDNTGNMIGNATTANKIQLDTPQSLYKDYLSNVIYGADGAGVDSDGNGLVEYGGDGAIKAIDVNGNGVYDSGVDKDVYYGVLNSSYAPDTAAYNPAAYQDIGYAKTGAGTKAGVMDGVLSAAARLKEADNTFSGTTLNIYPATELATVDETPGSGSYTVSYYGGATLSSTIYYSGRITGSGRLPDSVFCPSYLGSKVYLVDTMGTDITLQLPTDKANIMLITTGTGKLNLVIPEQASTTAMTLGTSNMPFLAVTSETYLLSGLQTASTSLNYWVGGVNYIIPNAGMYSGRTDGAAQYTAGSQTTKPTEVGKITVYVGQNVNLEFIEDSFISGVVYAPHSEIKMTTSTNAPRSTVYFNPPSDGTALDPATQETQIYSHIIGNLVCSGYDSTNDAGVMFLPSDVSPDPGLPNFSWKSTRYLSGR